MLCVEHIQKMSPLVLQLLTLSVFSKSYGWTVERFDSASFGEDGTIHVPMLGSVFLVQA